MRGVRAALVLALASMAAGAGAAESTVALREVSVKAVFLYNFVRFVQWPEQVEEADRPVVIGVFGKDPFGATLDAAVAGEEVFGRPLVVKRIARLEEAERCDEVFIAGSAAPQLRKILAFLEGKPVLTVSDIPGFAAQGGMIGLVSRGGRTKIQINPDEAKAAGLQISSKLLRPAEIVSTRKKSNSLPIFRVRVASAGGDAGGR